MKKSLLLLLSLVLFVACGKKENSETDFSKPSNQDAPAASSDASSYDPNRGLGKFDKVDLAAKLDQAMADSGQKVLKLNVLLVINQQKKN